MPAIDPELLSKLDSRRRRLDTAESSSPRESRALTMVAGQAAPEADFELVPLSPQHKRSGPQAYSGAEPVQQHANPAFDHEAMEGPQTPLHARAVGWLFSMLACILFRTVGGSYSQACNVVYACTQYSACLSPLPPTDSAPAPKC